jgi:hypothetical protein
MHINVAILHVFFMIFKEWVLEGGLKLSMLQHQVHRHKIEPMNGREPFLLLPVIFRKMS